MLYIHHQKGYSQVVFKTHTLMIDKSNITVIKKICETQLFSYESRIKNTKTTLNIQTRVPLYVHDYLLLIPLKSPRRYDNIWVNYHAIKDIRKVDSKVIILFENLKEIKVEISFRALKNSIKHAKMIKKHMDDAYLNYAYLVL